MTKHLKEWKFINGYSILQNSKKKNAKSCFMNYLGATKNNPNVKVTVTDALLPQ